MRLLNVKKYLEYLRVLNYIKEKGKCTTRNLLECFGISKATLYRHLDTWENKGYIKKQDKKLIALPCLTEYINRATRELDILLQELRD